MSEIEPIQSSEEIETGTEAEEARELNEVTHEPSARVENTGNVKQAEVIETAFSDLVGTDKKISQTDPPERVQEAVKPAQKKTGEGDAVTPINLPSPEKMRGKADEKAEPDPKGSEVKLANEPKTESAQKKEDESDAPDSLEATPITLPDKQSLQATPITLPSQESKPDAIAQDEMPEQARMGVEKETDLGGGVAGLGIEIPGIEGLPEDDPFSQGDQGGIGEGLLPGGLGPNLGALDGLGAGLEQDMPRETPGGPGLIHPTKGPMGQGMVMDGGEKGEKGQQEGTEGQSEGTKGQEDSGAKGQDSGTKGQEGGTKGQSEGTKGGEWGMVITRSQPGSSEDNPVNAGSVTVNVTEEIAAQDAAAQELMNITDRVTDVANQIADNIAHGGDGVWGRKIRFMPRPDGDDGTVEAPKSDDDIKAPTEAIDPTMMEGGPHTSGIDHRKHQGVVSDPAEWQDPDTPDGGIKTDRNLATDPPGEEIGKEKGKSDE